MLRMSLKCQHGNGNYENLTDNEAASGDNLSTSSFFCYFSVGGKIICSLHSVIMMMDSKTALRSLLYCISNLFIIKKDVRFKKIFLQPEKIYKYVQQTGE